ncbi:acylphosphatase [Oceanobacillus sp. CFH 90083]|uniref:acylphosphatase n=1 Tax=Oceanobacillus sp. CFH 90083 TaxID=2592336 RepID=UPI00128B7FEF|nr:acylphosphatase [Oceanobacillus sp. CFH 90083]
MDNKVVFLPNIDMNVASDISGFRLCSYLIALEGWRRGLKLKWYKDESNACKLQKVSGGSNGVVFSLSDGQHTHFFFRSRGDKVANEAVKICGNKEKTKNYLRNNNVPTPLGEVISNDEEILAYAQEVGFPVIIKPINGSMGRGVYTNINSKKELEGILKELRSQFKYKEYLVEKHYYGKEYRIYVVGDQVIGATYRVPANIIGDGINTIEKLIEIKNEQRKSNPYLKIKPIKVDYEVKYMIDREGYDLQSVPEKGKQVFLREKSNLSSGGDPLDATDELSPEVKEIAVNAFKALPSIPHGGVDIIVNPEDNSKGVVLEINATAEIGFHFYPLEGKGRDIGKAVIDYYFPKSKLNEKSLLYFDYESILEPLASGAVDDLVIADAPLNELFTKKYVVSGKVRKVGYVTYIRKQALRLNLIGSVELVNNRKVEITVVSDNRSKLDDFVKYVKRGSKKSIVKEVYEESIQKNEVPIKLGFHINS